MPPSFRDTSIDASTRIVDAMDTNPESSLTESLCIFRIPDRRFARRGRLTRSQG